MSPTNSTRCELQTQLINLQEFWPVCKEAFSINHCNLLLSNLPPSFFMHFLECLGRCLNPFAWRIHSMSPRNSTVDELQDEENSWYSPSDNTTHLDYCIFVCGCHSPFFFLPNSFTLSWPYLLTWETENASLRNSSLSDLQFCSVNHSQTVKLSYYAWLSPRCLKPS